MNRKVRLVVCDIDGTLVGVSHELHEKTREVMVRLHEQGVLLGIASGRPLDELKENAEKWGLPFAFDLLIGMNGGELLDGRSGKEYAYFLLKKEWIKSILQLMKPFEANCIMYQDGYLLCSKEDERAHTSSKTSGKPLLIAKSEEEFYEKENAKVMYRVKEEDMERIERYVEEHPSPFYQGFKTQKTMIEFADRRVSKAFALKKFCEFQKLSLEDVMAFGDTSNDNSMLQVSGWGVCLSNGSEDTKQIANDITEKSCEEDGVAWYVEEHILNA